MHTCSDEGKPVLVMTKEHRSTTTDIDTNLESGILTIDQAAAYLAIPKATLYTSRTRRAGFGPRAVRDGVYRSRTRIRDKDGVTREVTATGTTRSAAERALREKLVDRVIPTEHLVTGDHRREARQDVAAIPAGRGPDREHDDQRVRARAHLCRRPRTRRSSSAGIDDQPTGSFPRGAACNQCKPPAKTKVVLGAMLGLAVRHDALAVNPVQQTSRIHREKTETRSLTLEDLDTFGERSERGPSRSGRAPGRRATGPTSST